MNKIKDTKWTQLAIMLGIGYLAWPAIFWELPELLTVVIDDAFYYFEVARNIVAGNASTFDGANLTNGYHPLWMLLILPIYGLTSDLEAALRLSILLQVLLVGIGFQTINGIFGRGRMKNNFILIFLFLFYLRFIFQYNSGVESGLVIFLLALIARLIGRLDLLKQGRDPIRQYVKIGLLLALLTLARFDYLLFSIAFAFLIALVSVIMKQQLRATFVRIITTAVPSIFLVGGQLLWNQLNFGHILTITGRMKSTFPLIQPRPLFWIPLYPEYFLIALVSLMFIVVVLARLRLFRSAETKTFLNENSSLFFVTIWLAFGTALHFAFVSLYGIWAVRYWYFAGYLVSLLFLLQIIISYLFSQLGNFSFRLPAQPFFGCLMAVAGVVVALVSGYWSAERKANGIIGFQPYAYQAALWVNENLPNEVILGMHDVGTFGYFSNRRVINLDGLINNDEYQNYLLKGKFSDYLQDQMVTYLVVRAADHPIILNRSYGCIQFSGYSRLYNVAGGSVAVCEDQEVYRSAPFQDGTGAQLIIWSLPNVRR